MTINYLLRLPDALEVRVVDHGRFPLAVHLVVPVFGFGGVRVGDVLGLVPVLGFGVIRVGDGRAVVPVFGLLGFWVLESG